MIHSKMFYSLPVAAFSLPKVARTIGSHTISLKRRYQVTREFAIGRWFSKIPDRDGCRQGWSCRLGTFSAETISALQIGKRPSLHCQTREHPRSNALRAIPPPLVVSPAMASAELIVAKTALSGALFRADPRPCSRDDIESMLALVNSTIAECSPPNVQV